MQADVTKRKKRKKGSQEKNIRISANT